MEERIGNDADEVVLQVGKNAVDAVGADGEAYLSHPEGDTISEDAVSEDENAVSGAAKNRITAEFGQVAPKDDPINQPEDFEDLKPYEQRALLEWIGENLAPGEKESVSSYDLKHYFEAVGFYITNGQFKGAMQRAGYEPIDPDLLNWHYKLDKKRPEGERRP